MLDCKVLRLEAIIAEDFWSYFRCLVLIGPKSRPKMEEEVAKHQIEGVFGIFHPPCFPPKSPTHSAGPPPKARNGPLEIDQNFDHFLTSILGRFGTVLGPHLGVMFGLFGGQVGPSSVQNAS